MIRNIWARTGSGGHPEVDFFFFSPDKEACSNGYLNEAVNALSLELVE